MSSERRSGRPFVATLASALVLLGVASAAADRLLRPGAFSIENVHLRGEFKHVDSDLLQEVILPAANGNFFAIDLNRVEDLAESVAWVDKAMVRRRWPRTLEISVEEHRLQARWGETAWIDIHGHVVELPAVEETRYLPRLNGPNGSHQQVLLRYQRWSALLAASGLRIRELALTHLGTWKMMVTPFSRPTAGTNQLIARDDSFGQSAMPRPFSVIVGKQDLQTRIARFARAFNAVLAPRSADIAHVDLRYPNGFAVKWTDTPKTGGNAAA